MIPRFRLFPLVRSLGPLTLVALVLSIDCTVSGGSISPDERFPYWEALNQPGNGMRSLGLSSAWKNLYATMALIDAQPVEHARDADSFSPGKLSNLESALIASSDKSESINGLRIAATATQVSEWITARSI